MSASGPHFTHTLDTKSAAQVTMLVGVNGANFDDTFQGGGQLCVLGNEAFAVAAPESIDKFMLECTLFAELDSSYMHSSSPFVAHAFPLEIAQCDAITAAPKSVNGQSGRVFVATYHGA